MLPAEFVLLWLQGSIFIFCLSTIILCFSYSHDLKLMFNNEDIIVITTISLIWPILLITIVLLLILAMYYG